MTGPFTVQNTIGSTYDTKGRLTQISDNSSTYSYSYDNLDRMTGIDNAGTPGMPDVVLSVAYDAAGNRGGAWRHLMLSLANVRGPIPSWCG